MWSMGDRQRCQITLDGAITFGFFGGNSPRDLRWAASGVSLFAASGPATIASRVVGLAPFR